MSPSAEAKGNDVRRDGKDRTPAGMTTVARVVAFLFALAFLGFGATQAFAQSGEIYSPCWSRDECLNLNGSGGAIQQPGLGECANNRCFCANSSCYDPRRRETACPSGQGKCYANPPPVPLTVAIGGSARVVDIGDYIAKVYNYGVTVAGILAGVMFVVGGFQYLTAGGSGRVTQAKERIKDALIGLLLVLGAYAILNTINPDVLHLQMPKIALVKKKLFVACQYFEMQRPCGQTFTLVKVPGVPDTAPMAQQYRVSTGGAADQGATTTTSCIGKSCSRAGSDDATKRCKIPPNAPRPTSDGNSAAPPPSTEACIAAPVAPYICDNCIPLGGNCQGSGPSSSCCSGFCTGGDVRSALGNVGAAAGAAGVGGSTFQGQCSNGADGMRCGVDADCFSHHCTRLGGNVLKECVSGLEGSPCGSDDNCEGGRVCVQKLGINACVTPGYMSPCEDGNDCPGDLSCVDNRCTRGGPIPCQSDDNCSQANLSPRTFNMFGSDWTTPDLTAYGPMSCWTHQSNWVRSDVKICKPGKPGAVCHTGQASASECGYLGNCYDGGIYDTAIISPSAGICNNGGPGEGCDGGARGDEQCHTSGHPNAKCSAQHGWAVNDYICTREGTEGMPCGYFDTSSRFQVVNTCDSPLICPVTVARCVQDPQRVCPH